MVLAFLPIWFFALDARSDPVDDALRRWDTIRAREGLPSTPPPDAPSLHRLGLLLFLEGDDAGAREVLLRIPASRRGPARDLLRVVQETLRQMQGLVTVPSASGRFAISHAPGPDEAALPYLLEAGEAMLDDLASRLHFKPDRPLRVVLAPTYAAFSALSGLDAETARRLGVVAVTRFGKVVLVSPSEFPHGYPFADTLAHELVHYALIRRAGEDLPAWFQEAVAKYLEPVWRGDAPGALSSGLETLLRRAAFEGRLIPLDTLAGPLVRLGRAETVALAFAELSSFLGYLVRIQGPDLIGRLADHLADGPRAFADLTGRSLKALASDWARDLAASASAQPASARADAVILWPEPDHAIRARLPDAAARLVRLGDLFLAEQRFEAAAARYRAAAAALPGPHPLLTARLAAALVDAGRPAEALDVLDRAGFPMDWFAPLARERGRALVLLERYREALPALLFFVRTNPYDPAAHEGLGRVWNALGQHALAERERRLAGSWR